MKLDCRLPSLVIHEKTFPEFPDTISPESTAKADHGTLILESTKNWVPSDAVLHLQSS